MAFGIPNWVIGLIVLLVVVALVAVVVSSLAEEGGLELALEALELLD